MNHVEKETTERKVLVSVTCSQLFVIVKVELAVVYKIPEGKRDTLTTFIRISYWSAGPVSRVYTGLCVMLRS